ncbi:MAG: hypothetical protein ACC649_08880, partial [Myxococcota bacterium]
MTSANSLARLVEDDDWSTVEDQNLTLAFAWTTPYDSPFAALASLPESTEPPAIEILTEPWDRGQVLGCLVQTSKNRIFFDRLAQGLKRDSVDVPGTASLLRKKTITRVEFQATDDAIIGTVNFEKPECFRGRLPFEGHRTDQGWVISAFTLPGAGWRVERGDDGCWRALRMDDHRLLPDLETLPADRVSVVQIVAAAPSRVKHNGEEIDLAALPDAVAGRLVTLRAELECRFGDVLETLAVLDSADPPVIGVFWITRGRIGSQWCILGMIEPSRSRLSTSEGWFGTLERIERDRLPRKALQLSVGDDGFRFSNGRFLPVLVRSAREVVAFGVDEVKARPEAVFLMAIDPETTCLRADEALDAVWATKAQRVFVYTDRNHGFLFEAYDPPPPASMIVARRSVAAAKTWPTPAPPPPPVLAPPADPGPLRFIPGGKMTRPERVEGSDPVYPEAAEPARI